MSTTPDEQPWMSPSRIIIVPYPRTASNLLMRMLCIHDQPNAVTADTGGYFFYPANRHMNLEHLLDLPYQQWTDEDKEKVRQLYQLGFDKLHGMISSAEAAGKTVVFKEHALSMIDPVSQCNYIHRQQGEILEEMPWKVHIQELYELGNIPTLPPTATVLPNEFLARCFPIFLIRHPALAFPSYCRYVLSYQNKDMSGIQCVEYSLTRAMTLTWTRRLYDWYMKLWDHIAAVAPVANQHGVRKLTPKPIILDADDLITNPEIVIHLCDTVGLDSTKVQFTWDTRDEPMEGMGPSDREIHMRARTTLYSSAGIVAGKTFSGLTVDGEVAKWKVEFGEVDGSRLERWVREAMGDYEYLWERRFRGPDCGGVHK
ncbi:hypothetical protein FQN50_009831 [Emmonsiellopsis sp. PD_5]|nr:hypothetical protein FQN50_009831 [Emmonsiellopsis sp. PD_5]